MRFVHARKLHEDSGATVVEFTVVFLFLLLPLTLFGIQLVLSTFIRQQATAAARDGARAAVVGYNDADDELTPSTNNTRIQDAVLARLAFAPSDISVRCTGPDDGGTSALADIPCGDAKPDRDRVEVTVEMVPIKVTGPFGIFLDPLLPATITSEAAQVVVTKG